MSHARCRCAGRSTESAAPRRGDERAPTPPPRPTASWAAWRTPPALVRNPVRCAATGSRDKSIRVSRETTEYQKNERERKPQQKQTNGCASDRGRPAGGVD